MAVLRPILFVVALVVIAATANAQGAPSIPGGSAMPRPGTSSNLSARLWQFTVRLPAPWWTAPRWLPGRPPAGGSLPAHVLRPLRRDGFRSWLP